MEKRLAHFPKRKKAVDLFCYLGSWGQHALRAQAEEMHFVDQANVGDIIKERMNTHFAGAKYHFFRQDAFKFLQEKNQDGSLYDLVICDPPAFSKEVKKVSQALEGYRKLVRMIFPLLSPGAIFAFSSCTFGVTFMDLDKMVGEEAQKSSRWKTLLSMGTQGADHPFPHIEGDSQYIKYLLYYID
jgi:23S rRNA (cytosine1962-C5)-methyltransferase